MKPFSIRRGRDSRSASVAWPESIDTFEPQPGRCVLYILHLTSHILQLNQALNKDQERGSSTPSIHQDKMMDEPSEVSGGSCSKGTWRQFFEATGDILSLCKVFGRSKYSVKPFLAKFFFSETWALPITVIVAIMAYALLAVIFYNMDAWLFSSHIYMKMKHIAQSMWCKYLTRKIISAH